MSEMKNLIPRAEHPNPQWERANWKNLNGEWMFEIDQSKSGEERGLQKAETLSKTITLPFCPESELSGINEKDFMYCVWYKKALSFTEADLAGNRVIFHIGAADFETKVWVNGTLVGLPHVGGFVGFEYDITKYLTAGDNLVTIACYDDTRDPRQGGGKQSIGILPIVGAAGVKPAAGHTEGILRKAVAVLGYAVSATA